MTRESAVAALLLLCVIPAGARAQEEPSALAVARRLVDAFNRHDPAGMAALVAEGFELYYVSEEGRSELATRGPSELASQMAEYFRSHPTVRSTIEGEVDGPRFASFRERAGSLHGEVERSASSLAVYEVVDGAIVRVWYYPAEAPRSGPASR
jgi:hypothetical protein